jgi:hypothetical protein
MSIDVQLSQVSGELQAGSPNGVQLDLPLD